MAPFVISPPTQSRQPSKRDDPPQNIAISVDEQKRPAASGPQTPEYHVDVNVVERLVVVKVALPGVESVAEIDVEPGSQSVSIAVSGKYSVVIALPRAITEEGSKAKFIRSKCTLTLTFPFA